MREPTTSANYDADGSWDCPAHSTTDIAVGVRGNRVLLNLPPQPCKCAAPLHPQGASCAGSQNRETDEPKEGEHV